MLIEDDDDNQINQNEIIDKYWREEANRKWEEIKIYNMLKKRIKDEEKQQRIKRIKRIEENNKEWRDEIQINEQTINNLSFLIILLMMINENELIIQN